MKLFIHAALFGAVLVWWTGIEPSNDRDWSDEYAELPSAEFDGDLVTVRNIRNFAYSSADAYQPSWETRTYDLGKLTGVDMFFSYWGSPHIAHTMVSWQFEDNVPLIISIETRREKSESYSAFLGFFKQFELYYVVADERDLIKLRTDYRGEDVFLYRMPIPVPVARKLLLSYLDTVNKLKKQPAWYNALTHNCTTSIRHEVAKVSEVHPITWQLILNGHLPKKLFDDGRLTNVQPFSEYQRRSEVSAKGKLAADRSDFSAFIRESLPPRMSDSL